MHKAKSEPTAGKSGPTAGNSDPAETFKADVTALPRDVPVQKDADASVSKPQQDGKGGISGVRPEDVIIPAFFRTNQFAVLADVLETHSGSPSNAEVNATTRTYERKTPRNLKKSKPGRPRKPVDQQHIPTQRTKKQAKKPSSPAKSQSAEEPKAKSAPEARDPEDWMYRRERFHQLDKEYGPFTLDAAASTNGDNAQCKAYCSKEDSFLEKKISGANVWANFPFESADKFLQHYLEEKARDPTISGMFVLPEWKSTAWWSKVQHMERVRHHPAGEDLFTAPPKDARSKERRDLGPSPCLSTSTGTHQRRKVPRQCRWRMIPAWRLATFMRSHYHPVARRLQQHHVEQKIVQLSGSMTPKTAIVFSSSTGEYH